MHYRFTDCLLDIDALTLTRSGQPVAVEPQVFDLIRLLVENPGRVVTRDEIVAAVWGGRIVSESAISARIAAARKAVGDDGKAQKVIRTVARRGLQMVAEIAYPTDAAPNGTSQPKPVTPPRVRYTSNPRGQMLAYTLFGTGPPVLNVSFFARSIEREWHVGTRRTILESLAQDHEVACYDEIGSGLSDPDMTGVTYPGKAEDALAAADAAGFGSFSIFAESGGALPAIILAATHPDRVRCIVISGGYAEGHARRGDDSDTDYIRALISAGWDRPGSPFTRTYLTAYCPDGPYEAANEVAEMMRAAAKRDNMLHQRDLQNNASVVDYLGSVQCPVLLIHGRRDSVHPLSGAQRLASGIPRAELHVLDSANHLPLEGSGLLAPYLDTTKGFLAEHGRDPD
ncbi:alpha/beta fold hydrolase [Aestuariicoccus sp. MJ-SS9]|uniref:alpha/beta fold hydrolase n=1 Tax=Aestuariicoccus sp. MJ-SS9 TaxID=3079855 RepID=UPI00290A5FD2|nr:alpha/beta fold hydrolase [Aestuariicoccus sp. MJ-SS9]MDU8911147.1 alpha/beta fold hydrolase [Aestuariicoccus sp. MJ-SS9]